MLPTRRRNPSSGFTLLELVVVLVMLSFAAGLIFQRVGGTSDVREAKMFAKELALLLKKARRTAVNTGGPVTVWISDQDAACILDDTRLLIPETVQIDGRNIRQDDEGQPYVRFAPDGGSSGGELIVMTGGTPVAAMRIDLFTGAIQAIQGG